MEAQAHRFASAFLLPARTFTKEWITSDIDSFKNIKVKWKSAIAAMVMRAGDLGIVSDSEKQSLLIMLGRKGWKRREPFDDDFQPERPQFFARACEMIVSELVLSRSEILEELAFSRPDVEGILALNNFFEEPLRGEVEEPQPFLKFQQPA
jgi:Zn-dependent peptidase ImmA (M78 family)